MHLLLVTPWFTAGAGIVIAAMLAVDLPHTVLSYGPYQSPCHQNCLNPEPSRGSGSLANAGPGQRITEQPARRPPPGEDARSAGRPDPAGLKVGYRIVRQWDSGFLAAVTLPSEVAVGSWKLWIGFRSARVEWVWGADWQPSADGNSGTISAAGAYGGGPSAGQGPAGQDGQADQHAQGGSWEGQLGHWALGNTRSRSLEFVIFAVGAPQAPTGCVLSGKACTFS
jgi:hypothetical protein